MKTKKCINCDKIFQTSSKRIYCSEKCCNEYQKILRKTNNPKKYREYLNKQNEKRRKEVRKRLGLPLDHPKINETGKGFKLKDGYIYLLKKDHPNVSKSGYVAEHVVVMTQFLNRPLDKKETIHHKNGIRNDNRIENLELWSNSHPYGQRIEDKIQWCKEFLDFYGFDVLKRN